MTSRRPAANQECGQKKALRAVIRLTVKPGIGPSKRRPMDIDIRAVRRLRESAGARAALGPLVEALAQSDADLATTRVVCDWIQYKSNFRDTVAVRPVIAADVPGSAAVDG